MKKMLLSFVFVCGLAYSASAYIILWGHYKSTGPNSFTCMITPYLCAVVQEPPNEPDPSPWWITVYNESGTVKEQFSAKSCNITKDSQGNSQVTYELP